MPACPSANRLSLTFGLAPVNRDGGARGFSEACRALEEGLEIAELTPDRRMRHRAADDLVLGKAQDDPAMQRYERHGPGPVGGEETIVADFGGKLGERADRGLVADACLGCGGRKHQRRAAAP